MLVSKLHYHRRTNVLDIHFDNGEQVSLSAEFLRVHSPSAEVQGHHQGPPKLVTNKKAVAINEIEAIGHYAVRLQFDDGHQSGLYSFGYLAELCSQAEQLWQTYLERLKAANAQRDASIAIRVTP
ncbi:gamma-butyrobetaine hydroxylase-like domain-containing protein [Pseudoalteromonas sp. YIC-827]|uniref:Gamma-butyrobetaine hydroxylase-like domain-containing protein n=1 Tax=Pseudoalteromonas qingdaonensis TaxID=3131913 RepID=A0ABU9N1L1_9GAMM